MLSRCFHFGVFEIFVSSLFLLVLFAFWECWYSALYNSEADSQEEDHDGSRCLYLPCCCSPGSPIVLRSIIRTYKKLMNGNYKERQSLPRLPTFQRSATSSWIYGSSRAVHLLGSRNSWRCHTRLYHSLLYNRFRCRINNTRCFYLYGSCFNPL